MIDRISALLGVVELIILCAFICKVGYIAA